MSHSTVTEELLEARLSDAVRDPARRDDFLRALLEARVWVIGTSGHPGAGEVRVGAGATVRVTSFQKPDGSTFVPFFTSRDALSRAIPEATPCFAIATRALFEMTRGSALVLNPGSLSKEFFPEEVESLLAHGPGAHVEKRHLPAGAQMLLGQPAKRPVALLDALALLFGRRPRVSRAFLALVHVPSRDPEPSLVIGIEIDGDDLESLLREAAPIVSARAGPTPVDFVRVAAGGDGVARYMLEQTKPFYQRR